ncbi:MAG TPA: DNA-directed RNA polymerase subunit P [archaeon]|nr:DNA-directed RNA polymerase subunit P [archaeon]
MWPQICQPCLQGGLMGTYRCFKCGKRVDMDLRYERVRCPFCGYKILVKMRAPTVKTLKAR